MSSTTTTTMTSTMTVHDVGMLVDPCPYAVAGDRTHLFTKRRLLTKGRAVPFNHGK